MPYFAFPPNLIMGINRQLLWTDFLVSAIIPFLNQIRSGCQKIIVTSYSIPAAAIWTSVSKCAVMDGGKPTMVFIASPPDFFLAPRRKVFWQCLPIFIIIPFGCKQPVQCPQVIVSRHCIPPTAIGASMPRSPVINRRLPAMSISAFPPGFPIALMCHHTWGHAFIFRIIPFHCKRRVSGCKIIIASPHLLSAAIGAPTPAIPSTYSSLPVVAFPTFPPDFPVAPTGYCFW